MIEYQEINSSTIDEWVRKGWEWGIPVSHEIYAQAEKGNWAVYLTPVKTMPAEWFPKSIEGLKILGLAAGGGQQMPVFSALKARCTVLDYSKEQIKSELMVAEREGYTIETIRYDMTKRLPFEDESFDIIFHPVSNVYIEEVKPLFRECFRVLKKGGIFVAGLDNGINFMTDDEITINNHFPFNPLKDRRQMDTLVKNDEGVQFSHTMEEQIGGQLEAGFIITDLYEDTNKEGRLQELNIPTFLATRAIKPEK